MKITQMARKTNLLFSPFRSDNIDSESARKINAIPNSHSNLKKVKVSEHSKCGYNQI